MDQPEVDAEGRGIEESCFDDPDRPFAFWLKSDNQQLKKLKLDSVKLFEGHLFKKSSKSDFWKSRFFVLYRDRLNLLRNSRQNQEVATMLLLTVRLDLRRSEKIIASQKDKFPIIFIANRKEFILHASSLDTYNKWIAALRPCCILTNYRQTFTNLKVLGKGSFAKVILKFLSNYLQVLLGQRNSDKHEFAVKTFDKKNLTDRNKRLTILTEIQILRCCSHANIIQLFEVFESSKFIYIVMELLRGGELFETIMSANSFQERTTSQILFRLLGALDHLHQQVMIKTLPRKNIMHRDIKPENIILKDKSQEYEIKLADFGLGTFLSLDTQFKKCGTPGYLAPEILDDQKYDEKVDVFSAGVILYILQFSIFKIPQSRLSGCSPFYAKSYNEIMNKNRACQINFDFAQMGLMISPEASDLLQKMLTRDPKERISAKDALNHPFILKYNCDDAEQMANFFDNESLFLNMKRFFEEQCELSKQRPQGIMMQSPLMGFKFAQEEDGQRDSWLSDPCSPQNKPMYVNQLMMQHQLNDNESLNSSVTNTPQTPVQNHFRSPKFDQLQMSRIQQAQIFFQQFQRFEQEKQLQFKQPPQPAQTGISFMPLQKKNENPIFNKPPIKTDSQTSKTSIDKKANMVRNQLKKMGV